MSDIPLAWMIEQIEELNESAVDPSSRLSLNQHLIEDFKQSFAEKRNEAILAEQHDSLKFGRGSSFLKTCFWWVLEILPTRRLELIKGTWLARSWPPNLGSPRDIPKDAAIHPSVKTRIVETKGHYMPMNDGLEQLRVAAKEELSGRTRLV
ncbi:MAG: hypothetical protein Q9227_001767 [Pyrenula ochraceoflavens]